jgi:hypothetical protein
MRNVILLVTLFVVNSCLFGQTFSFASWVAGNTTFAVTAGGVTMNATYSESANYRANTQQAAASICASGTGVVKSIPFYYTGASMPTVDYSSTTCYCLSPGLTLAANWPSIGSANYEQVVLTFSKPICKPTFNIYDLNSYGYSSDSYYTDIIEISATDPSGSIGTASITASGNGCAAYATAGSARKITASSFCTCGASAITDVVSINSPKVVSITIKYYPGPATYYGTNPNSQYLAISNIVSTVPPTVSIATPVCNTNSTTVNLIGSASGTISPTYAWSTSTGTIISGGSSLTANVKSPGTFTLTATNNTGCSNTATVALTTLLCNLLPVELITFSAKRINDEVKLNWTTATELNNDYFIVERSLDGISFQEIKQLKAYGNSNKQIHYTVNDDNPSEEILYYRLKQTDFNGKLYYSDVISIDADNSKATIGNIAPNPTASSVSFDFYTPVNGELNYEIMDLTGRVLISKSQLLEAGHLKINILMNELPNGIYFLKATFDKTSLVSVNKIIKN